MFHGFLVRIKRNHAKSCGKRQVLLVSILLKKLIGMSAVKTARKVIVNLTLYEVPVLKVVFSGCKPLFCEKKKLSRISNSAFFHT